MFDKIVGHSWDNGILLLELAWTTGESSSLPFTIVKRDYPLPTAHYILHVGVGTADGRYSSGRYTRWANGLIHQVNRTVRRLRRMASGDILRLPDGQKFQVDDSLGTARLLRRTMVDPLVNQRPWKKKKKKILAALVEVNWYLNTAWRSPRILHMLWPLMRPMVMPCGRKRPIRRLPPYSLLGVSTSVHRMTTQARSSST